MSRGYWKVDVQMCYSDFMQYQGNCMNHENKNANAMIYDYMYVYIISYPNAEKGICGDLNPGSQV